MLKSNLNSITSTPFWPLIKVGIIIAGTVIVAKMLALLVSRWSSRSVRNLKDRQKTSAVQTRNEVLKRVTSLVVYLAGFIILISQFPVVKNLGMGLFASAGAIGLIIGFAAQSTLSNMISGIVLSVSQPLRLDDAVIMDGDFGYIEEITLMQTFIRTWDNRRIIVPNDVLSNKIIHNWSIKDPSLLAATIIHVDYNCDIEQLREWIVSTVKESDYWSEEGEPGVQVIDFSEKTVTVRALAWADDPPSAWNLRCEIRESLINHFREEGLEYPKFRVELQQEGFEQTFGSRSENYAN